MRKFLIGIGHQSRVGKDTCGNYITSILKSRGFDSDATVTSFAKPLKHVTHLLFKSFGVEDLEYYEANPERRNDIIPELDCTVVDLWIGVGRKMREVYAKVWLSSVLNTEDNGSLVVRDVRFMNEAEAIRSRGGVLIKVTRPGQVVRGADAEIPDDFEWDYVIANTGTIADLRMKCVEVVNAIYKLRYQS